MDDFLAPSFYRNLKSSVLTHLEGKCPPVVLEREVTAYVRMDPPSSASRELMRAARLNKYNAEIKALVDGLAQQALSPYQRFFLVDLP